MLAVAVAAPLHGQGPGAATPVDVYMACRHPAALVPATAADSLLRSFCRRGLPDPQQWTPGMEAEWLAVPDSAAIRAYARQTLEAQRQGVERLRAAQNSVRGPDDAQGLLGFSAGAELDPAAVLVAGQIAEALAERIRSGAATGVVIRGYPDTPGDTRLGLARAGAVEAVLKQHPFFATRAIVLESGDATEAPAARLPGLTGKASVHLVFPLRAADAFASLGEIRFAPRRDELDDASLAVISRAAEQIRRTPLPTGAPIVVYGYADSTGSDAENERLAQRRAEAIRGALLAILQDEGFTPDRIVARGRVLTEDVHNSTAARREQVRSGAILAGGNDFSLSGSESRVAESAAPPAAPSTASMLSIEGVASAAAQVLVERAEREVEGFLFQLVGSEVCSPNRYRHLLPETCLLVHDPQTVGTSYRLSFGNLQEVLRRDFSALPTALVSEALVNRFTAQARMLELVRETPGIGNDARALRAALARQADLDTAAVRRALSALEGSNPAAALRLRQSGGWAVAGVYGMEFVRRVSQGENPLRALQQFPAWLDRHVRSRPGLAYLAESPPVARVATFARFMSGVDTTALAFAGAGLRGITTDTLHLYALRAALVNVAPDARRAITPHIAHLVWAGREFQQMLATGDSLRRQLRDLRDGGEQALAARRQLVSGYVGDVAATFYTLLPASLGDLVQRDTAMLLAANVRDVVYALSTGELRTAFAGTVSLISHLLRPQLEGVQCGVAALPGCGRLGLDPRVVRLAAFASDIGEAQTEVEARDAMSRFLESGSDVSLKRTGPPVTRFFVNGYVTASGELNPDDDWGAAGSLQVPLGLELVWRRRSGKPDWTHAVFLRLVELGGFLPNESQDEDRSTDELIASLVRPGLFYLRGVPGGYPVTFGLGVTASLLPQQPDTLPDDAVSWEWEPRISAFIGWDIPIFP